MPDAPTNASHRPTLRELEVLRAVIAARKTTAAAARLGISQPAVSRALAALEARTGRHLFVRDGGRLAPTADALTLDRDAARILEALDRLTDETPQNHGEALLKIAAPPTLAQLFLAPQITDFLRGEPDIRVQMEMGKTPDVVSMVAEGAAHIGFSDSSSTLHPGVLAICFRRGRGHIALPKGHALARRKNLTASDLAHEPIVALTRRFPARARFDKCCSDAGVEPRIVMETSTSAVALAMVRAGVGLALLNPFPLALEPDPDTAFVPFEPRILYETAILLPANAPSRELARRFAEHVRAHQPDDPYTQPIR